MYKSRALANGISQLKTPSFGFQNILPFLPRKYFSIGYKEKNSDFHAKIPLA